MNETEKFDAIIIGTGQSGKPLALALAHEGWKVAVIEKRFVGGTCINYGCTPTKAMIASARIAYLASRSKDYGIHTGKVKVKLNEIKKRKDKIVKNFRERGKKSLESNKNIKLIFGTASFADKNEIKVKLKDRSIQRFQSQNIFINTGARPMIPDINGLKKIKYFHSETIMDVKQIPSHLVIIGGSYIGLEFGQMFRRFGSEVTIIERGENILSREDEDVSIEIKKIMEEDGIKIYTGSETIGIKEADKKRFRVKIKKDSRVKNMIGSHILIAVGIKPNIEELNLQKAGIETDERGYIKVNDRLETNVTGVYAMGDVKGGPAFTHISYDDYRVIFSNLMKKESKDIKDRPVPYTVFIDPQLGRIGLSEKEAQVKKLKFKTAILPMRNVARAIETGETRGFMKAIVEVDTKQILGAAILGIEGGELMAMIQIAMMGNLPYTKLRDGIFSHPTLSEALNNIFMKIEE